MEIEDGVLMITDSISMSARVVVWALHHFSVSLKNLRIITQASLLEGNLYFTPSSLSAIVSISEKPSFHTQSWLSELAKVLKPGGSIFVQEPSFFDESKETVLRESRASLKRNLLYAGFSAFERFECLDHVAEIYTSTQIFELLVVKAKKLWDGTIAFPLRRTPLLKLENSIVAVGSTFQPQIDEMDDFDDEDTLLSADDLRKPNLTQDMQHRNRQIKRGKTKALNEPMEEKAAKNVIWDAAMDNCLCDLLIEQVEAGKKVDGKFTAAAWRHVVYTFNKKQGTKLNRIKFKNRLRTWRKMYLAYQKLENLNGFRWDPILQCIVADESVWEAYLQKNQDMKQYKNKPCPIYEKLRVIVGKHVTDGSSAVAGEDDYEPPMDNYSSGNRTSSSSDQRTPIASCGDEMPLFHHLNDDEELDDVQDSTLVAPPGFTPYRGIHVHPMPTTLEPKHRGKIRKRTEGEAIAQSMDKMVNVVELFDVGMLAGKHKQDPMEDKVDRICKLVPEIPDILPEHIYLTIKYLTADDRRASVYLGLHASFRRQWFKDNLPYIVAFANATP